jgi:SAM-dependent methyltransferase
MAKRISLAERLGLYVACVQHPEAEVGMLGKIYEGTGGKARKGPAMLLREDFCGTGALASAWVGSDPDRQAMGVDVDGETLKWAWEQGLAALGEERAGDLHLVEGDATKTGGPKVDVVCALNFSVYEIHERGGLVGYFKKCRTRLAAGGVMVVDGYYGPGALATGEQSRKLEKGVKLEDGREAVTYFWEQKSVDLATGMVENHIHVGLKDKTRLESLFVYKWRLWSPMELSDAMRDAGFKDVAVWGDADDATGRYLPLKGLPTRKDVVVYVVGG